MSPGASTTVPFTVRAAGKARTRPPGQWAMVPGSVHQPCEPARTAPASDTRRSVPAALVMAISSAASSSATPRATRSARDGSCGQRSAFSGCSAEIISTRPPPARISPSSGACSSPSAVQSTTKSAAARAATAARCPARATEAPVERMGTGPGLAGVGMRTSATAAPVDSRARRAVSTISGLAAASYSSTAVSPGCTSQARNCSA